MQQEIIDSIYQAVDELIANATSEKKLSSIIKKHSKKVHFIPVRYRVLGGILQSMNIQFGNFLETTIRNIVALNPNNEILTELSGKKSNKFSASKKSIQLIDEYITNCQIQNYSDEELKKNYLFLLQQIIDIGKTEQETTVFSHDIDLLFKNKNTGTICYVEIKYNDDHDTGKFIDINRKLLYTTALIIRKYKIKNINQIQPVLMYFNNKKMKGNNYLPESLTIYRGKRFFDTFTTTSYDEIDKTFANISQSKEINDKFDALCKKLLKE